MWQTAQTSFAQTLDELTLFVRQVAWLNTIPKGAKRPRRETKPSSVPPLGGAAYLIEILFEVGPSKPIGMGGSAPIDDVDLAAWMANQNVRLKPWEAQTIRKISREYAAMLSEAVEPNTPPPWVDPDLLNQERREKIAKAMSNWADNINAKTRN